MSSKVKAIIGISVASFFFISILVGVFWYNPKAVRKEQSNWSRGPSSDVFPPFNVYCSKKLNKQQCNWTKEATLHVNEKSGHRLFIFKGFSFDRHGVYIVVRPPTDKEKAHGGKCFAGGTLLGAHGSTDRFSLPADHFQSLVCFNKIKAARNIRGRVPVEERDALRNIKVVGEMGSIAHEIIHPVVGYPSIDHQHPRSGCGLFCKIPKVIQLGETTKKIFDDIVKKSKAKTKR